jgi:hypothetical protein
VRNGGCQLSPYELRSSGVSFIGLHRQVFGNTENVDLQRPNHRAIREIPNPIQQHRRHSQIRQHGAIFLSAKASSAVAAVCDRRFSFTSTLPDLRPSAKPIVRAATPLSTTGRTEMA